MADSTYNKSRQEKNKLSIQINVTHTGHINIYKLF